MSTLSPVRKSMVVRFTSVGFFSTYVDLDLCFLSLNNKLRRSVVLENVQTLPEYYYSFHSAIIGGYNKLSLPVFNKEWIMHRLDWESAIMLLVY